MSIRVGSWNALNAFGDETLDDRRLHGAMEVVRQMDADVLTIQEFARRGAKEPQAEQERLAEATSRLKTEGYQGVVTRYSPYVGVRDMHYLSLWSRVGGLDYSDEAVRTYGQRHGLEVVVPGGLRVLGIHFDDRSPQERVRAATAAAATLAGGTGETIIAGDWNDMHKTSPNARLLRILGKTVGRFEVDDYYDESRKLQRLAGKVIRVARLANGDALETFTAQGFHDADPVCQPTLQHGRLGLQVDHLLGSPGVTFEDFIIHGRDASAGAGLLSDHFPISAIAKW